MLAGRGQYFIAVRRVLPGRRGEGTATAGARRNERRGGTAGLSRTCGIRGETGHEGVQRFRFGGYPSTCAGDSAVIHQVGRTLPRPQSTAKFINPVAGRLPLSAQRPAPPEVLAAQGPSAKPPSRPSEDVRSSEV